MSRENPFKLLDQQLEAAPPELRGKVMADVSKAKLILEIASLFGDALPASINDLFINNKR
ncbi:hypothetical protein [Mongoliitalea lutea]|uniref:Uncharacterized protein n=1 Tax=Mongoliitalea lutea TaxID=849756 RepID=A0A8J3CT95_9BACT|nr:hypothetical protein [Mongoliitalea lutea]GHB26319.1 hypothetical protein GCM10008106_03680 [Mongoliitalea lutea]